MIAIQEGHEALAQYSSILLWERESIESIAYLALFGMPEAFRCGSH